MSAEVRFYRCAKCGKTVVGIEDTGCVPECCGQEMELLEAGSTDAAQEKHVPVATQDGDTINVKVGEVAHPMLENHYIEWIALVGDGRLEIHKLHPGDEPQTSFAAAGIANAAVYAYCNLHGLWKADL